MSATLGRLLQRAAATTMTKPQLCLTLHGCAELGHTLLGSAASRSQIEATLRSTLPYCDAAETAMVARSVSTPPDACWLASHQLQLAIAKAAVALPPKQAENLDAIAWALLCARCSPLLAASPMFVDLRAKLREELRWIPDVRKLPTAVLLRVAEALTWAPSSEREADPPIYTLLAGRLRALKRSSEDIARALVILQWSGSAELLDDSHLSQLQRSLPITRELLALLIGPSEYSQARVPEPCTAASSQRSAVFSALHVECLLAGLHRCATPTTPDWDVLFNQCVLRSQEALHHGGQDPFVLRCVCRFHHELRRRAMDSTTIPASTIRPFWCPEVSATLDQGSSLDTVLDATSRAGSALKLLSHPADVEAETNKAQHLRRLWEALLDLQRCDALDERLVAQAVAATVEASPVVRNDTSAAEIHSLIRGVSLPRAWADKIDEALPSTVPCVPPADRATHADLTEASLEARALAALQGVESGSIDTEALAAIQQSLSLVVDRITDADVNGVAYASLVLVRCGVPLPATTWSALRHHIEPSSSLKWEPVSLGALLAALTLSRNAADAACTALDAAMRRALQSLQHQPSGVVAMLRPLRGLTVIPPLPFVIAACDAVAAARSVLPLAELFECTARLYVLSRALTITGGGKEAAPEGGQRTNPGHLIDAKVADLFAAIARDATPPIAFCQALGISEIAGLLECCACMQKIPRGLIDAACSNITSSQQPITFDDASRVLRALNALFVPRCPAVVKLEARLRETIETSAHVAVLLGCLTKYSPADLASTVFVAAAESVVTATPSDLQALATAAVTSLERGSARNDSNSVSLADSIVQRLLALADAGTHLPVDCTMSVLRAATAFCVKVDTKRVRVLVDWLVGDALHLLDGRSTVDLIRFLAAAEVRDADYAHALTAHLVLFADKMEPALLAEGVFALSQAGGYFSVPLQQLADVVVDRAGDYCEARPMIRLLHGFSKMGVMHRGAFNTISARLRLRPVLRSATVADTAVALDAFAGAKYLDDKVFAALSSRIQGDIEDCCAIDLALAAQSHADLYVIDRPLFDRIADRATAIAADEASVFPLPAAVRLLESLGACGVVDRDDCVEAVVMRVVKDHGESISAEEALRIVGAMSDMEYAGQGLDAFAPLLVMRMEEFNSVDLKELTVIMQNLNWRGEDVLRALGDHAVRLHAEDALEPLTARCVLDTLQHFLHYHPIARAQLTESARSISRVILPDDQPLPLELDSSDSSGGELRRRAALA